MKKGEIDVAIYYEHVVREYDTAFFIQRYLENRGFSVRKFSVYYDYWRSIANYSPRLIIPNSCTNDKTVTKYTSYSAKRPYYKILNMHHEQVAPEEDFRKFFYPCGESRLTGHISWSKNFTCFLQDAGVPDELIYRTGNPRWDAYRPEMKEFNASREELSKKFDIGPRKRWVLFAGNFVYGTRAVQKLRPIVEASQKEIDDDKSAYLELMDWISYVMERLDEDVVFIYRPHPDEIITGLMLEIQSRHKGFRIIPDMPIQDWILQSGQVMVWRSTSSVDSLIAKKPTYIFRPANTADDLPFFPIIDTLPSIRNKEQFLLEIEDPHETPIDRDPRWSAAMAAINEEFYFNDTSACKLIADKAIQYLEEGEGHSFEPGHIGFLKREAGSLQHWLKRKAWDAGILHKIPKYYAASRDRMIEADD